MKAAEFDERFEAGEDPSAHVDWTKARRLNVEPLKSPCPTDVITPSQENPASTSGPLSSHGSTAGSQGAS